jgi:hypothetical protein
MYPHHPLSNKALEMHSAKGSNEYLATKYSNTFINSDDAYHARELRYLHYVSSSLHLLNGAIVAWICKNQSISTLHSTGSEIISLLSDIKKTIHINVFFAHCSISNR